MREVNLGVIGGGIFVAPCIILVIFHLRPRFNVLADVLKYCFNICTFFSSSGCLFCEVYQSPPAVKKKAKKPHNFMLLTSRLDEYLQVASYPYPLFQTKITMFIMAKQFNTKISVALYLQNVFQFFCFFYMAVLKQQLLYGRIAFLFRSVKCYITLSNVVLVSFRMFTQSFAVILKLIFTFLLKIYSLI